MRNKIIGIDPGVNGAIALYDPLAMICHVYDMPTIWIQLSTKRKGKIQRRKRLNYQRLTDLLQALMQSGADHAWIEKVGPMPRDGAVGAFTFGEAYGAVKGACSALNLNTYEVRPQVWKAHFDLIGEEKDLSRNRAIDLFGADDYLLKKDHNKAEAALIACYGAVNQA